MSTATWYEEFGGAEFFRRLVDGFYRRVETHPVLRPLYPDEDFAAAPERLRMFLEQYWGGPSTYSEQRGHPRLRMRHHPFRIGVRERDAWLATMRESLDDLDLAPDLEQRLWEYLVMAAHSLVNTVDDASEVTSPPPR